MKATLCFVLATMIGSAFLSVTTYAQSITMTLNAYVPQTPTYAGHAGAGTFNDPAALQYFGVSNQTGLTYAFPSSLELFCIELQQNISPGSTNAFSVLSPDQGSSGGSFLPLGANIPTAGIGLNRASNLEILYGHVFGSNYQPSVALNTDALKSGFQLAVWELSHDDSFSLGGDQSLTSGSGHQFWVTSASDAAIVQAQAWVDYVYAHPGDPKMALVALHNETIQDFLAPDPSSLANIPEPSTYALLAGLTTMTFAFLRRRVLSVNS